MAVVLLTNDHSHSYAEQGITMIVLFVVLLITLVILRLTNPIHRFIGNSGSNIMIRVMGPYTCCSCHTADNRGYCQYYK